jgi:hypothetical protein
MVSPSKKKRKVTTTKIKAAISKEKKAVLTSSVSSTITSPNRPGRQSRSSLSPSFKSKTAAISHPSSSKIYPPLSNTSFFSSIRSYSKDGTDMTSELSKNILNDFDLKYNKKNNNSLGRRSVRLIETRDDADSTASTANNTNSTTTNTILSSYRRCLLEDFMVLQKDTKILVLLPVKPKCPLLQQDSFWSTIDSNVMANYVSIIQFKKIEYHCVAASIETNPKLETVQSGISHFDLMEQ